MQIDVSKSGDELRVAVAGSIDTVTAPEVEETLKSNWRDAETLLLDFANVDYVSSAGLRVIMEADKFMSQRGGMRLRNVSEDVMEVFEMTGFNELLTFE